MKTSSAPSEFSVVVICKNEEDVIGYLLQSVQGLSDDIIIYDNGSTDTTIEIARSYNASVYRGRWEGYGKTRINAAILAKYDWILMLDADEALDSDARQYLSQLELRDNKQVYDIRFKNYFGDVCLHYGEWGSERHIRLFNRRMVNCDAAIVHEKILLSKGMHLQALQGNILHRTAKNIRDYADKVNKYADLWAERNRASKKRYPFLKIYVSPPFTFINYYFFKGGFMDGRAGFICAVMSAYYTFLKYARLFELSSRSKSPA